ncbi:MAG: hypothetical protein ACLQG5_04405 [Methanobacterium sp.]|jgi:hypothetical protein
MVKESLDALKLVKSLKKPKRNMILIIPMKPVEELTNLKNYFKKVI